MTGSLRPYSAEAALLAESSTLFKHHLFGTVLDAASPGMLELGGGGS